jgi:hypothetical protein
MSRWKVWLALGVVFCSGLVLGAAGTGLYVRHEIRSQINSIMSGDVQTVSGFIMTHLGRALDLQPEQEAKIRPIVEQGVQQVRTLRSELRPRFEAIYLGKAGEIKAHLTPTQSAKLDNILERVKRGMTPLPK